MTKCFGCHRGCNYHLEDGHIVFDLEFEEFKYKVCDIIMKDITIDNIIEKDNASYAEQEIVFKMIKDVKVDNNVPKEISSMIELIVGNIKYGYFYYPFYTIAVERASIVYESAINIKFKKLYSNNKFKNTNYKQKVEKLYEDKFINRSQQYNLIKYIKKVRDTISHPADQIIVGPNIAIVWFIDLVLFVNDFFSD